MTFQVVDEIWKWAQEHDRCWGFPRPHIFTSVIPAVSGYSVQGQMTSLFATCQWRRFQG